MDADTRHQLKTNELADALNRLRDWNNPSTRAWVLGVVAVVLLLIAWRAWSVARTSAAEQKWQQFGDVQERLASQNETERAAALSELRTLINAESGTSLGGYARLLLARVRYGEGLEKPDQRSTAFQEAATLLDEILGGAPIPPVEAAASFARASVHESQAAIDSAARDQHLDAARKLYQHLVDDARFEGSPFVSRARQRLDSMDALKDPVTLLPGNPPPPPAPATQSATTMPAADMQPISAEEKQRLIDAIKRAQATSAPAEETPAAAPPSGTNETPAPAAEPTPEPPAEPSGAPGGN